MSDAVEHTVFATLRPSLSEVNAVDAEHTKNITNDHWRISMVDRSLANPESVYNRFTTGLASHPMLAKLMHLAQAPRPRYGLAQSVRVLTCASNCWLFMPSTTAPTS